MAVLIVLWAILIYLIYWVLTQEREFIEWDPYEVLQLDRVRNNVVKTYTNMINKEHIPSCMLAEP